VTEQRKNPRVRSAGEKPRKFNGEVGRGSWIRTNDLQYPKLPRYQAALYPETSGMALSIHVQDAGSKASGSLQDHPDNPSACALRGAVRAGPAILLCDIRCDDIGRQCDDRPGDPVSG
jgi:hypothetical protein